MKTENENNMQDFFKKSLDQFDQVPSSKVWEDINARLDKDEEKLGILSLKNYLYRIFPIALLLLLISGLLLFNKNDDQLITTANPDILIKTPEAINSNASIKNTNAAVAEYKTDSVAKNKFSDNLDLKENKESRENAPSNTRNNKTIKKLPTATTSPSESYQQIKQNQGTVNVSNAATSQIKVAIKKTLDLSKAEQVSTVDNLDIGITKNKNAIKVESEKKSTSKLQLVNIAPTLSAINSSLNYNSLRLPNSIGEIAIDTTELTHKKEAFSSKYRIGINSRFFNIFLPHSNSFNESEAYGISQELRLNDALSLTNSIDFNVQHYDITRMGNTINNNIVGQYTNRSIAQNSITRIESNSEYIDFDLGLKWHFRKSDSKLSYFINPSVVWQLYLPQSFVFTHAERGRFYRNDNRVTLYFGSARVRLGGEYKLNDRFHYQFSIWGEQGFTEIGVEQQRFNLLGISNTLLFSI